MLVKKPGGPSGASGRRRIADEQHAAIDLAVGRPVAQRGDRGAEGRGVEDAAVDEREAAHVVAPRGAIGEGAREECGAVRPGEAPFAEFAIDLGQLECGEDARDRRGGARGECEFGDLGEIAHARLAAVVEAEHEAVFGFDDLAWRVQLQAFGVAVEVGDGHEQVERQAGRDQRRSRGQGGHRGERVEDVAREVRAREGRLEPAAADQAAEFAPHLVAHGRLDLLEQLGVAAAREPDQRLGIDFAPARGGRGVGVEQAIDVGLGQPEFGQRAEILAGRDRVREEDRVDAARRRAREDIDDDLELLRVADAGEQIVVDALAVGQRFRLLIMEGAAGAHQFPNLLADAVHVDGEADPAVAHQRQPQFLLAHGKAFAWRARGG